MRRKEQGSRRSRQKPTYDAGAMPFYPGERQDKRQLESDLRHYVKFKYKEEPQQPIFRRKETTPTLNCITLSPYYQFALKFAGSFTMFQADPNIVIDWGRVAKVTRMSYDLYQCPICLESDMTAPRISKCGHCFCYPCILRYFLLDDQRHKRCPICFDTVKKSWLRPVTIQVVTALQDHRTARFGLMRRRRGYVTVERCGIASTGYCYQGFHESRSNQAGFNRIALHLDERQELNASLAQLEGLAPRTDWSQDEIRAINSAIETLKARLALLPEDNVGTIVSYSAPQCPCTSVFHPLTLEFISATPCPRHPTDQDMPPQPTTFDLNVLPESVEPARNSENFIYFYSLADGQPVFIHPLNIAMLKREFETYANFPNDLEAPVLEMQRVVMTEAEQKRQK